MGEVLLLTTQRRGPAAYVVHDESKRGQTSCGISVGDPLPHDAQPSEAERAEAAQARRCQICFPDQARLERLNEGTGFATPRLRTHVPWKGR